MHENDSQIFQPKTVYTPLTAGQYDHEMPQSDAKPTYIFPDIPRFSAKDVGGTAFRVIQSQAEKGSSPVTGTELPYGAVLDLQTGRIIN